MTGFVVFSCALLGLMVGSFLNVVIWRVPRKESVVTPASHCPGCNTPIAPYDNVPVASWVILRAKCRGCGDRISARYPLVELGTALLVAGCVWKFGFSWDAAVAALFCCALVAVTATDLEHRVVPNRIVVPAAVGVLAAQTLLHPSAEWALAALGAGAALLACALAYPAGMGMGDVKLGALLGAMLGRWVLVAVVFGVFAALVPAVLLLFREGSRARKQALPFAPFLALGGVVALFAGPELYRAL